MNQGERVNGRYKIIKKVGSGGMANVYLADDLILEREVAVKLLSLDFQEDKDSLRRFQREALSTTELTHPNIVNIYDVGEGDEPYIVMEYVDGMDLKQYIRQNHPIPYQKAIDIMDQILSGIAYAHENDVIHRDIKPHNILIDKEGKVKITDFGIAVALSQNSITQTNSLLGSVQYISPEQARGNVVTKQSDIYSLGIVLYELLTGSVPFEGESAVSIALKHFQTPIPSIKESDSRISQALENVVLKATAKEPKQRYASVEEMKTDLQTTLSPSRRSEPVFIPLDIAEEDTLVLDANQIREEAAIADIPADEKTVAVPLEPTPKEEPKKKRKWWLLLIPLILVVAFVAFLLSRPQQIVIPEDLIGLTEEEAIEELEGIGLIVGDINLQNNEEVEEGIVFRVNPNHGSTVLEGSEVDLYVSLGEAPYEVEDYVGENFDEIRALLDEAGFTVEQTEPESHETIEAGRIIAQDIEPGESVVSSDTTITFTVSSGRPYTNLTDLTRYSRRSVEDYATRNELNLTIEEEASEEMPLDLVIRQSPEPNTQMYAGDSLTVVISTGPEEVVEIPFSREITIPYEAVREDPEDETSQLLPNNIEIFIEDLENTYDEPKHYLTIITDTNYVLNFIVREGESARYKIVRDGETVIEEVVQPGA